MNLPPPAELLIVEDNPSDLELTLRALRKTNAPHQIHVTKDGDEALEYLFCNGRYASRHPGHAPRVIFLDLKLPKIDGMEVLRRLKTDDRTRLIPVVMLTSSAQDRDLHACYELGANSYIVKPVDMEQFMAAVNSIGLYWLGLNLTDPH